MTSPNSPSAHGPWWRCPACWIRGFLVTSVVSLVLLLAFIGAIAVVSGA